MRGSKRSSCNAERHLPAPPARPTTRQPRALARAANALPTAPVAALTTTVSPSFGAMILTRPYQAVPPGMPTAPRWYDSGTWLVSTWRNAPTAAPSTTLYSCQPPMPSTLSPTAYPVSLLSTTPPTSLKLLATASPWGRLSRTICWLCGIGNSSGHPRDDQLATISMAIDTYGSNASGHSGLDEALNRWQLPCAGGRCVRPPAGAAHI